MSRNRQEGVRGPAADGPPADGLPDPGCRPRRHELSPPRVARRRRPVPEVWRPLADRASEADVRGRARGEQLQGRLRRPAGLRRRRHGQAVLSGAARGAADQQAV